MLRRVILIDVYKLGVSAMKLMPRVHRTLPCSSADGSTGLPYSRWISSMSGAAMPAADTCTCHVTCPQNLRICSERWPPNSRCIPLCQTQRPLPTNTAKEETDLQVRTSLPQRKFPSNVRLGSPCGRHSFRQVTKPNKTPKDERGSGFLHTQ